PPSGRVVGRTVEDLETDFRMLKPDPDKLYKILGHDPDRQSPFVERLVIDIADANAGYPQPVFVGVECPECFAECLAHAVTAVRPHSHVDSDLLVPAIKSDRVI